MIQIEHGIPMPTNPKRTGLKAAISQLLIGESFIYHNSNPVHAEAKRTGIKVATRMIGKDQYRIWRIA